MVAIEIGGDEMIDLAKSPVVSEQTMMHLLRRNAAVFQTAFALLWSVRFALVTGVPTIPVAAAIAGAVVVREAFRATQGLKAREVFRTTQGRSFMRPVTRLTIVQIVASIVLPAGAGAAGATDWVVPIVALTIGLFLIVFSPQLRLPIVGAIGALVTAASICLPFLTTGDALLALTSSSMTVGLFASAVSCALGARVNVDR